MRFAIKLLPAVAAMCIGTGVAAQETTEAQTTRTELRQMASEATPGDEADRAAVRAFLDRSDVRSVAAARGIEVRTLREGVETLEGDALSDLANRVRSTQDHPDQVGGDTFVISSTAIIIALLVIILVVVA